MAISIKEARVMFEKFHRGDIYSADLSPGIGSEQSASSVVSRPSTMFHTR